MKKIFLIILAVIFIIIGFMLIYTNHKSEKNIINTGYLILDFEDNEDIINSHIYDFSNNIYEKIKKENYQGILEYCPLDVGYYCIERENIYDSEQRNIIIKTENADTSIPIDLATGNIKYNNNRVFYLSDFYTTSDDYELCFIDISTNKYNSLNKRISSYCLFNGSVYYVSEGCLYSNNFDLNNEKKINDNCKLVYDTNNYLIFQTDDGIYKFDPLNKETILFCDIRNYDVVTAVDDNNVMICKQKQEENNGELYYSLFNPKQRYYILNSDGRKKELSALRGKGISNIYT